MSADVMRGSRSTHASASCASDLAARSGDLVQRPDLLQRFLGQEVRRQRARPARPRALGNAVQVLVGEHALRERREDDAADAELAERIEQLGLDPAVQHRVRGLVDEQRSAEVAQDRGGLARLLRRVRGDAGVERLALPYRRVERSHRLLERRLRVEAMRVEDVDVVEAHAREALVEAREQVLAGAPFAVGTGPHVVAGFRRDDELVAIRTQILVHERSEVLLGRAVRRPVVVGEVEVRDPEIERPPHDGPARLERAIVPEVPPQPERDRRQLQAAATTAPVEHAVVAVGGRNVGHDVRARLQRGLLNAVETNPYVLPTTDRRSRRFKT